MSGIAKPTLFFSTALTQGQKDDTTQVEQIKGISKLDCSALGNNPASYHIIVAMVPGGGPDKKFDFVDAATRDTAFTAAKTLISASV